MRTILIAMTLAAAPAFAQVSGNAQVYCAGDTPVLNVSASASFADAGKPGAWFVAAHDPYDASRIAYLTPAGWAVPDAPGTIIAYQDYPAGIPGNIAASACVPAAFYTEGGGGYSAPNLSACGQTTEPWAGHIVKVGYGVLTQEGEMLVATRRERLDFAKPTMIETGKWRAEYEDDDHMRKALVIKHLREPGNIIDVLTVPHTSCYISG